MMLYVHNNARYLPIMKKSLKALIGPMSRTEFLANYLKNAPVVTHGLLDNFLELRQLPFLKSLEDLLNSWPDLVTAYNSDGVADEANSKKVSTFEARKLFEEGSGLCFDDANRFSPCLEEWPENIRADLGLSALTFSRSLIYATKEGKGTAPHFDQNINFVIQISGTKKWWIAPNKHVENPLTRHTIGIEMDPELSTYAKDNMPELFPDEGTEYILKPGSVLFVPRGSWHMTEAESDALSLNFTFTAPCWMDILLTALRGRLAQSSEWRETANFVTDSDLHNHANEKFGFLLKELGHDVPNWNARDILDATEMGERPS
ncbi:MAG: cupin domain-containing protein [Bdellovibrionota bacterium]|nr:cupin domain-containing protein [Bdellovibrionota bacterium]